MAARFLIFICISFTLQDEYSDLYEQEVKETPALLQKIFDLSLSHQQLIAYFKDEMKAIAPDASTPGEFLSEVIFNYVNFDAYSQRPGIEISPKTFIDEFNYHFDLMKESLSEEALNIHKDQIIKNANGLVKSSKKLFNQAIFDADKAVRSHIELFPAGPPDQRLFSSLSTALTNIYVSQFRKNNILKDFYKESVVELEKLLISLTLTGYQANFDERHEDELKLRILEIHHLIFTLYHYKGLREADIEDRNKDLFFLFFRKSKNARPNSEKSILLRKNPELQRKHRI